jgi:hypothetical protein
VLDRKVCRNEPHLVAVTLGNTCDHVLDMTEKSTDTGDKLPISEALSGFTIYNSGTVFA